MIDKSLGVNPLGAVENDEKIYFLKKIKRVKKLKCTMKNTFVKF
jgi:hypothetical protein